MAADALVLCGARASAGMVLNMPYKRDLDFWEGSKLPAQSKALRNYRKYKYNFILIKKITGTRVSTRASVATFLSMHSCVSSSSWVNNEVRQMPLWYLQHMNILYEQAVDHCRSPWKDLGPVSLRFYKLLIPILKKFMLISFEKYWSSQVTILHMSLMTWANLWSGWIIGFIIIVKRILTRFQLWAP